MHGIGNLQKAGWPTLTGSLKGSGSQVPSVVLLVVRGRQHLSQAEQQLSERRQQMPSHHIQLEVLHSQQNSGITSLPSADDRIRKQGVRKTKRKDYATYAVALYKAGRAC